jgi:hypothetical protein
MAKINAHTITQVANLGSIEAIQKTETDKNGYNTVIFDTTKFKNVNLKWK